MKSRKKAREPEREKEEERDGENGEGPPKWTAGGAAADCQFIFILSLFILRYSLSFFPLCVCVCCCCWLVKLLIDNLKRGAVAASLCLVFIRSSPRLLGLEEFSAF